ncbi:hypothetical protein B0T26DRAFT_509446 [Lasiosphaeria miniovina]|uniref:Uncharacterized protein n=1 Tax=Lasiosphaeria miniovina TaxID=1954250 RepID=A0AA39ZUE9_9PEZI|nr:uncharacterized protein B0T26DRAFT_509446 [Lasiosphaeria miniovina]KAK0703720.1 hypothetical protein B0T26DRAFT_509446 [Lasiosphaeria miniovina]
MSGLLSVCMYINLSVSDNLSLFHRFSIRLEFCGNSATYYLYPYPSTSAASSLSSTMAYTGFSKLQPSPVAMDRHRFSRLELALITPLLALTTAVEIYAAVYMAQHRKEAVQPLAVVALSCASLVLLSAGCVISLRLSRHRPEDPSRRGDVESAPGARRLQISAPIPITTPPPMKQTTFDSKGVYTVVPGGYRHPHPQPHLSVADKLCLALFKRTPKRGRGSTFTSEDDGQALLSSGSERSSADMSEETASEGGEGPGGLWNSVFELAAGDAHSKLDQRRRRSGFWHSATPPQRQPRHEAESEGAPRPVDRLCDVTIVLTRPDATAAPSAPSSNLKPARPAMQDPLRSHPVQILRVSRDPSVRQTRSTQTLASPAVQKNRETAAASYLANNNTPRRPRSAEPGPDRSRLGYDLATLQLYLDRTASDLNRTGWMVSAAAKTQDRASRTAATTTTPAGGAPRAALRRSRSPSPTGSESESGIQRPTDLRAEYRDGVREEAAPGRKEEASKRLDGCSTAGERWK